MKKLFTIFMCLVLCFCFVGCKNTEERNEEAKAALTRVLNNKENFTVHNVYTNKTTEENLKKFNYPTYSNALHVFVPDNYTFVDFDKDGIEELLIIDILLSSHLFLKYDDGRVYGYVHDAKINNHINLKGVKTDGSFVTSAFDGYEAISRISFSGTSYEITQLAYKDDSSNKYLLNGKPAKKSEVEAFIENRDKNTTEVAWTQINQQ